MRIGLVLSCLLLAAAVEAKDLVVKQRSSSGFGGGVPSDETVYITNDKIVTDAAAMRTIVDLTQQNLTSIDKSQKTYAVISFDDLRKQMDMLRQSLDSMPPDARKQMAALFDDSQPVVIKETGKTETIAGHAAKEHSLSGGPYSGYVWTTEEIETPTAFTKWKELEGMRGGAARRLGEAMQKLKGFPLRTKIDMKTGGNPISLTNEVSEVKEGNPPKDALTVPPGYAKTAPRGMPGPPPPPPPAR
jgi:hypothetical protein